MHYIPHSGPVSDAKVITKSKGHRVLSCKYDSAAPVGGAVIVENKESREIVGIHSTKEATVLITAPILNWLSENLDNEHYGVYERDISGVWQLLTCMEWEEDSEDSLEDKPENFSTGPCFDQKQIEDPQTPEIVLLPGCNVPFF